jgi:hypothetical protein
VLLGGEAVVLLSRGGLGPGSPAKLCTASQDCFASQNCGWRATSPKLDVDAIACFVRQKFRILQTSAQTRLICLLNQIKRAAATIGERTLKSASEGRT